METTRQKAIRYHTEAYRRAGYPAPFDDASLPLAESLKESGWVYALAPPLGLPDLQHPRLVHLTEIVAEDATEESLVNSLKNHGETFLALVESYNKPALAAMARLGATSTYYCQVKLLYDLAPTRQPSSPLPDGIHIRSFRPGQDESAYADFYNQVLGFLGTTVNAEFVQGIVARPTFDPEGYFLAVQGKKIVGFLSLEVEPWGERGSGFGYIYQVGVAEEFRKTALAGAMLRSALNHAASKGVSRVGVGVRATNVQAMRYFQKFGFTEAFTVTGYRVDIRMGLNSLPNEPGSA